jgi:hypothetical protein
VQTGGLFVCRMSAHLYEAIAALSVGFATLKFFRSVGL